MSKELEALKRIRQETCPATYMDDFDKNECCDVIEQALKRLESIDNANPSEALRNLECLKSHISARDMLGETNKKIALDICNDVEQALLKAQENEKVLKIIKEKPQAALSLIQLGKIKTYEEYLEYTRVWDLEYWDMVYTEEEFDLIKRWSE